jgi:hypothetical protein
MYGPQHRLEDDRGQRLEIGMATSTTTITWLDNLDEAENKAAQEHKLVLLDFFSPK